MNPAFSARLPQAMALTAKRPRSANTSVADRKQVFVDTISEAIERGGLLEADMTALLREVDRLRERWPEEARGLVLAHDLSPKVRRMLAGAIERAGLTVIEHQPSSSSSSSSSHVHAAEMKRPQAEDVEEAVGPEVHLAPLAPSRTPLQNIDAIEGVLNRHCSRVRKQDGDRGYVRASRTRDAVIRAVMEGASSVEVEVDLPAAVATELAQLGLTFRPFLSLESHEQFCRLEKEMTAGNAAAVTAVMNNLKRSGLRPDQFTRTFCEDLVLGHALAEGHAAAVTAFMNGLKGLGLSKKDIADIANHENAGLSTAMMQGHAAGVIAFMDGLKAIGLSPQQFEEIVCCKGHYDDKLGTCGSNSLKHGLNSQQPTAVAAFMGGLNGAGLSTDQVFRIVAVGRFITVEPTAVWGAYRDGLKWLAEQQLITANQLSNLETWMWPVGVKRPKGQ